jgi:hypothetical protein
MNDDIKALYARFGISPLTVASTWLDLDPVERRRLWRRAKRKAQIANTSRGPKPALIFPELYV